MASVNFNLLTLSLSQTQWCNNFICSVLFFLLTFFSSKPHTNFYQNVSFFLISICDWISITLCTVCDLHLLLIRFQLCQNPLDSFFGNFFPLSIVPQFDRQKKAASTAFRVMQWLITVFLCVTNECHNLFSAGLMNRWFFVIKYAKNRTHSRLIWIFNGKKSNCEIFLNAQKFNGSSKNTVLSELKINYLIFVNLWKFSFLLFSFFFLFKNQNM